MAPIVRAWSSQRDSVACATPVSFASDVADLACGPLMRWTILRLKLSEYSRIVVISLCPGQDHRDRVRYAIRRGDNFSDTGRLQRGREVRVRRDPLAQRLL